MAVQIPTLQRVAPQAPGAPDISQVRAPDTASGQAKVDNAILQAGSQFIKKIEEDTTDLVGDEQINQLRNWETGQVEGNAEKNVPGLRHLKGNPTPTWNKHRENFGKKYNDMLDNHEGSGKQKLRFLQKAASMKNDITRRNGVYYGTQRETWDRNTTNDGIKGKRGSVVQMSGTIQAGKPETLDHLSSGIRQIDGDVIDQALRLGQITPGEGEAGDYEYVDEKGDMTSLRLDDSAKRKLSKEASTTVLETVQVLTSGLRVAEAKMVVEKHGNRLDGVDKAKVNKMLKSSNVTSQATIFVGENENLSETAFNSKLRKDHKNNPEMIVEATKMRNSFTSAKINSSKREVTESVNRTYKRVDAKMNSRKPYDSVYQMQNDPAHAGTFALNLTPTQRKVLDNRVTGGTNTPTPPADFNRVMNLYANKRFPKMQMEELETYLVNHNKKDRQEAINLWKGQVKPLTIAGERGNEHQAVTKMKDLLKADGKYKTLSSSGKVTPDTERRLVILNRIAGELIDTGGLPVRTADLNRLLAAKYKSAMDAYEKNQDYNSVFSKLGRGTPFAKDRPLQLFDSAPETKRGTPSAAPVKAGKPDVGKSDEALFRSWSRDYRDGLMKTFRDANPGKKASMDDLVKLHKESK